MSDFVFVFGTLKEGFPNFHINKGSRASGVFVTIDRLPLYLVSERFVPWMINDPGGGEHVVGQVFQVDDSVLEQMDVFEGSGEPDGYQRLRIAVTTASGAGTLPIDVFAYLKEPRQLDDAEIRLGPLAEYTLAHAALYNPRPDRLIERTRAVKPV